MDNFEIDPELEKAVPPLLPDEYEQLEQNILDAGVVHEPLLIWNNTVVDGHNRWSIIQKHPEIKYSANCLDFPNKWAAVAWAKANALGQRNLTKVQKDILTAEYHDAIVMSHGGSGSVPREHDESGKFTSSGQNGQMRQKTAREQTADKFHVPEGTVRHDVDMLHGIQAAEEVSPGFRDKVMSGEVKASKQTLASIDDIPEEKREEVVKLIETGDQQYDDKLRNIDKANEIIKAELDQQEEEDAIENDPVYAEYPNDYDDVLGADSSELLEAFRKCMEDAYDILESTPQYDYLLTDEGYGIALSKVNEVAEKLQSLKRETL